MKILYIYKHFQSFINLPSANIHGWVEEVTGPGVKSRSVSRSPSGESHIVFRPETSRIQHLPCVFSPVGHASSNPEDAHFSCLDPGSGSVCPDSNLKTFIRFVGDDNSTVLHFISVFSLDWSNTLITARLIHQSGTRLPNT